LISLKKDLKVKGFSARYLHREFSEAEASCFRNTSSYLVVIPCWPVVDQVPLINSVPDVRVGIYTISRKKHNLAEIYYSVGVSIE